MGLEERFQELVEVFAETFPSRRIASHIAMARDSLVQQLVEEVEDLFEKRMNDGK